MVKELESMLYPVFTAELELMFGDEHAIFDYINIRYFFF